MPLEIANTIDQLVATNPETNDPNSQGDDHIRMIKRVTKNTWVNITGVVTATTAQLNELGNTQNTVAQHALNKADKTTTITAGNGLTGTGTLANNITFNIGASNGISVFADSVGVAAGTGLIANSTGLHIAAGAGFIANNTLIAIGTGDGIVASANAVHVDAKNGLVANSTGLFVGQGDGITSGNTSVSVDGTVARRNANNSFVGTQTFGGETVSTSLNAYRIAAGNTSVLHRYDGSNYYLLFANTTTGGYNSLRPLSINYTNGLVSFNNGISFSTASGNGAGITSLDATELTGTINDARISTGIARSAISISAGNGLSGGGNLTANRSFAVGAGSGITVGSTSVSVDAGNGLTANSTGVHIVPRAGLSANSSGLYINTGNGLTANTTHIFINAGNAGSGLNANSSGLAVDFAEVTPTGRTITAGNGLSGGGSFTANRTITLGTPSSITATSNNQVTATSHTHYISEGTIRTLIADGLAGVIGTYAFATNYSGSGKVFGATVAGNAISPAGESDGDRANDGTLTGTWRCMGHSPNNEWNTLWLRIA